TAAHLATVPVADGELGPAIEFRELRSTRHWSSSSTCVLCLGRPERHPEMLQEGAPLLVGLGRGHEADVQTLDRVDLVVVDLGEDDLLLEAERVVPLAVERLARDALEVARPGERDGDEAVEELPHAVPAEGDHRADGDPLAE